MNVPPNIQNQRLLERFRATIGGWLILRSLPSYLGKVIKIPKENLIRAPAIFPQERERMQCGSCRLFTDNMCCFDWRFTFMLTIQGDHCATFHMDMAESEGLTDADKRSDRSGNPSQKAAEIDKILPVVEPYILTFDEKLEGVLDEFENYDYTYKPLLTQTEFEDEFLVLIRKLFRRTNKYDLIYTIFDRMVMSSLNDMHKLLCLIDFMINISRFDPVTFKDLPNAIVRQIIGEAIFPKIKDYVLNKGRMNYQFRNVGEEFDPNDLDALEEDDDAEEERNVSLFAEYDSDSEDERPRRTPGNKVLNVSLAELTKKIMSKTKPKYQIPDTGEKVYVKKEESDSDDARIFNDYESASESEDHLSDSYSEDSEADAEERFIARTPRRSKKSIRTTLESLVMSDSSDDEWDDEDAEFEDRRSAKQQQKLKVNSLPRDRRDEDSDETDADADAGADADNVDESMNNATSIMEHIIDYRDMDSTKSEPRRRRSHRKKPLEQKMRESEDLLKAKKVKPRKSMSERIRIRRKTTKRKKPRLPKIRKPKSPVEKKSYYVLENSLDFLFAELERRVPISKSTLLKEKIKGFHYKPAQYSLFANLSDEITLADAEIRGNMDNLLNALIFQMTKRVAGNDFDKVQFVHPFECDYIRDNFEKLLETAQKLPPIVFSERFSSIFDYDGRVSSNLNLLRIKNTKVKGLMKMSVFSSEEEYFEQFKKIVPREKVGSRLLLLNNLLTDGKNIFTLDIMDSVVRAMNDIPKLMEDSEVEEENLQREYEESRRRQIDEATAKLKEQTNVENITSEQNAAVNENSERSLESSNLTNEVSTAGPTLELAAVIPTSVASEESEKIHDGTNAELNSTPNTMGASQIAVVSKVPDKLLDVTTGESEIIDTPGDTDETEQMTGPATEEATCKTAVQHPIDRVNSETAEDKVTPVEDVSEAEKPAPPIEEVRGSIPDITIDPKTGSTETSKDSSSLHKCVVRFDLDRQKRTKGESEESQLITIGSIETSTQETAVRGKASKARIPKPQTKMKMDAILDDRETIYCSSKGVNIPTRCLRKVLSTQELFDLFAILFFPEYKLSSKYQGIPYQALKPLSEVYDGLRPYLMSLIYEDVSEFLTLPRFFKVDSVLFELQVQDLIKSKNPKSRIKAATQGAKALE